MATYTGPITMLDSVPYTKGMKVPVGTFGIVGDVTCYHKHPSGLRGLYSPKGSTGWRASLAILVDGDKELFHMPVQAVDYEADGTLEA